VDKTTKQSGPFKGAYLSKVLLEGFETAAAGIEPPPSKLSLSLPKTRTLKQKISHESYSNIMKLINLH